MDAQNIEVFSLYDYGTLEKKINLEFETNVSTYPYSPNIDSKIGSKICHYLENKGSGSIEILEKKNSLTNLNSKVASETNYLIQSQIENIVVISNTFNFEKERLAKKGVAISAKAFNVFDTLKNLLNDLPIEKCGIELMEEKVKVTVTLPDNKMIMVSKPIDAAKKGYDEDEIMTSFFLNKRMINSNVAKIETFKQSFDEFNLLAQ